jgi:predicted HicB family RNase H-like nuclease
MEKNYSESKKRYNSNNTFIQIDKELHQKLKDYCELNNLSIKKFIENIIVENLKS